MARTRTRRPERGAGARSEATAARRRVEAHRPLPGTERARARESGRLRLGPPSPIPGSPAGAAGTQSVFGYPDISGSLAGRQIHRVAGVDQVGIDDLVVAVERDHVRDLLLAEAMPDTDVAHGIAGPHRD